jgi:hypothetical protein
MVKILHICVMPAKPKTSAATPAPEKKPADPDDPAKRPREIGGPKGPEPTRYGDWEVGGRCTDF